MSITFKRVLIQCTGILLGILYVFSLGWLESTLHCKFLSDTPNCQGFIWDLYIPLYVAVWIPGGILIFPIIGWFAGFAASRVISPTGQINRGFSLKRLLKILAWILIPIFILYRIMTVGSYQAPEEDYSQVGNDNYTQPL